jgi:hypothetical protein
MLSAAISLLLLFRCSLQRQQQYMIAGTATTRNSTAHTMSATNTAGASSCMSHLTVTLPADMRFHQAFLQIRNLKRMAQVRVPKQAKTGGNKEPCHNQEGYHQAQDALRGGTEGESSEQHGTVEVTLEDAKDDAEVQPRRYVCSLAQRQRHGAIQ